MMLAGAALAVFGLFWFLRATAQGYVSIGWLVSGGVLTFRGAMRVREAPSGVRFPSLGTLSPRTLGALATVALLLTAGIAVRALAGPGPLVDRPGTAPPSAGAWPAGYTAVAPDGAYRPLDTTSLPCRPGFRCSEIEVLTRTDCRLPQVGVEFFDGDGRRTKESVGIGAQNSSPDFPLTIGLATADPSAASYAIVNITCGD
jgi:hypothetical protein